MENAEILECNSKLSLFKSFRHRSSAAGTPIKLPKITLKKSIEEVTLDAILGQQGVASKTFYVNNNRCFSNLLSPFSSSST